MELRAMRDIKAGEELTTYYNDPASPAADRQKELLPYGFQCTCVACLNPAFSDPRRAEVYKATAHKKTEFQSWVHSTSLSDDFLLKRVLKEIKLAEEEGLEFQLLGPYQMMVMCYEALGDETNVVEWGKVLRQYLVVLVLPDMAGGDYGPGNLAFHRDSPLWGVRST
jgi:hypothetical protein